MRRGVRTVPEGRRCWTWGRDGRPHSGGWEGSPPPRGLLPQLQEAGGGGCWGVDGCWAGGQLPGPHGRSPERWDFRMSRCCTARKNGEHCAAAGAWEACPSPAPAGPAGPFMLSLPSPCRPPVQQVVVKVFCLSGAASTQSNNTSQTCEERVSSEPSEDSCPHARLHPEGRLGEGAFGAGVRVLLQEDLESITMEAVPEGYRLLLLVACARLCDVNLVETREDFRLISMLGIFLLGYVFNRADVHRVLGQK